MNLKYHMPTNVLMGSDAVINNANVFKELGKKAIIVTGKTSARKNGSLVDVLEVLKNNGQEYVLFDKVMSNPTIDLVYEGSSVAREANVDFVIAIGGGSPMDAAKSIALLSAQDVLKENLFSGNYQNKILKMLFIPTTAGTGSEVTQYSILTNDKLETKTTVAASFMFPDVAILDGKYMESLSKNTTINTAIDALSHAIEGYLSAKANNITDCLALESMKVISSEFKALDEFSLNIQDRNNLLYASSLAGMVIAHTGTTAVHSMGYSLTYFKDIDHGRANGLLLPRFLEFVNKYRPNQINEILKAMSISSLEELKYIFDKLLGEKEKITKEEIYKYSVKAIAAKNIANCVVIPTQDNLIEIMSDVFLGVM